MALHRAASRSLSGRHTARPTWRRMTTASAGHRAPPREREAAAALCQFRLLLPLGVRFEPRDCGGGDFEISEVRLVAACQQSAPLVVRGVYRGACAAVCALPINGDLVLGPAPRGVIPIRGLLHAVVACRMRVTPASCRSRALSLECNFGHGKSFLQTRRRSNIACKQSRVRITERHREQTLESTLASCLGGAQT